jgi:hypothetical protein
MRDKKKAMKDIIIEWINIKILMLFSKISQEVIVYPPIIVNNLMKILLKMMQIN